MDTAQRIKLIRMIEKIEKNPEFSSKIGVRNTSEFISSKQPFLSKSPGKIQLYRAALRFPRMLLHQI